MKKIIFVAWLFTAIFSQAARATPHLKVLTFNAWLLDIPIYPFGLRKEISEDMDERLGRMPDELAATHADILVLQEVWSPRSKNKLIRAMRARGYGYAAYTEATQWMFIFQTAMGDGLLVLSKFPITHRVLHHDFKNATQFAESFTSKGVMKVTIQHPELGLIEVYAAHLGAVDFENGTYVPEQVKIHDEQLEELENFIRTTRTEQVTLLAADLNMNYKKWETGQGFSNHYAKAYLKLRRSTCGQGLVLLDTYLNTHAKRIDEEPDQTFDEKNPYVGHGYYGTLPSEVEDYIFICQNSKLKPDSASLEFKQARLSDHYGVSTAFSEWGRESEPAPVVLGLLNAVRAGEVN